MEDRTGITQPPSHPADRTVLAAKTIYRFYLSYRHEFRLITRRAPLRFARQDWNGVQQDANERFDVYSKRLDKALAKIRDMLDNNLEDEELWKRIRTAYSRTVGKCEDREIAETFFNSVCRRVFTTVGVNPDIEFVGSESNPAEPRAETSVIRTVFSNDSLETLICRVLSVSDLGIPFENLERDAREIAGRMAAAGNPGPHRLLRADMMRAPFFRGKGAYLIGRLTAGDRKIPLTVAVINRKGKAVCDGLIQDEAGMRLIFSYTHTYFHVDVDSAVEVARFLKLLLPEKRTAELYISLGFNRHGKTELYRDLVRHQSVCEKPFDLSPGKPGMVMVVFNMPDDDLVFKVIRDRFGKPKRTTRREVIGKYDFVARHDRTGRLPDTQTFEFLKFRRCCFSERLIGELATECSRSVSIADDHVVLNYVYVERRVVPLDVFLETADPADAASAVVDYGLAIKDLALSNIFPGDLLLKNFGLTRLGRVIFYDYDEICPLTDCRFRRMPRPRTVEEEMAAAPWFHVEENDIFPEEFGHFLGLPDPLRRVLLKHHGDLLDAEFWRRAQESVRSGKRFNVFPYRRFSAAAS
ncbi:MAG: bifunctional isocitrate dehydrogenase kinase/phosphatase [Desulfobacterales bacterium]